MAKKFKRDPNGILARHRRYLRQLEQKKNEERECAFLADAEAAQKIKAFRETAAEQRAQIGATKTRHENGE